MLGTRKLNHPTLTNHNPLVNLKISIKTHFYSIVPVPFIPKIRLLNPQKRKQPPIYFTLYLLHPARRTHISRNKMLSRVLQPSTPNLTSRSCQLHFGRIDVLTSTERLQRRQRSLAGFKQCNVQPAVLCARWYAPRSQRVPPRTYIIAVAVDDTTNGSLSRIVALLACVCVART